MGILTKGRLLDWSLDRYSDLERTEERIDIIDAIQTALEIGTIKPEQFDLIVSYLEGYTAGELTARGSNNTGEQLTAAMRAIGTILDIKLPQQPNEQQQAYADILMADFDHCFDYETKEQELEARVARSNNTQELL